MSSLIKPQTPVQNGVYSEGALALANPTGVIVLFTNLPNRFGQVFCNGSPGQSFSENILQSSGYSVPLGRLNVRTLNPQSRKFPRGDEQEEEWNSSLFYLNEKTFSPKTPSGNPH